MVHAHVFQEQFKDTASLLIHRFGDPLHTATTGNATDCLRWGWLSREYKGWKDAKMLTGLVIAARLSRMAILQ